jgi:uncharacterized protein (UPF0332 family)
LDNITKTLIDSYTQKAEKKLGVAEKLFEMREHEDCVSRAYYAVFHAAQALLLTEGQRAEIHKGVVTLFSLLFIKTGKFEKNLAEYLSNLVFCAINS